MEQQVAAQAPAVEEYLKLRERVGWTSITADLATSALANSLYHVTIREQERLIAMARVVGDGALFFYLQDVVVDPEYQNSGVGHTLMESVENYLAKIAESGATIGLFAAVGNEDFYSRYGYVRRDGAELGFGMCKFVE